jgi:hypothetical protein
MPIPAGRAVTVAAEDSPKAIEAMVFAPHQPSNANETAGLSLPGVAATPERRDQREIRNEQAKHDEDRQPALLRNPEERRNHNENDANSRPLGNPRRSATTHRPTLISART